MVGIYDSSNFDPRASIGGMVGRTRSAFLAAMDEALAPFDLTTPQYVAIILVASGAAVRAADICKMLAHDPGAMTRLIDHLEQRKFVRRVSDPDDRRALKLELTHQGQALYPNLIAAAVKVNNRLLQGFSKGEVRQMETFFKRMLANAEDTATEIKS